MNKPADGLICVMCNEPATQRCTRCRSQIYCSRQCQKSDWRVHKLLCSSYQQFQTPPHENARRAIVFEQNEPVVKFKWVTIEPKNIDDPDDPSYEEANLEEYFGPGGQNSKGWAYYDNVIRGRRLRNTIDLRSPSYSILSGSPPNQAVAAVAPAVGGTVWCGPLIALKWDTGGRMPSKNAKYLDMEMGDLREVVDYLDIYGRVWQGTHDDHLRGVTFNDPAVY